MGTATAAEIEDRDKDPMFLDSTPGYVSFTDAHVYNEAAFRQFLAADWARAERLGRCLLLVLVSLRPESTQPITLSRSVAAGVCRGLSASVREGDIVGWLREGRVAAGLLVQGPRPPDTSASAAIAARVGRAVGERLPSKLAGALRVRVHRLGASFLG
jgi:hypothetical protein